MAITAANFWNMAKTTVNGTVGEMRIETVPIAPSNCKNCGAPLNWLKRSCEYCKTFFR